jgi:hypothetical protein
MHAPREGWTGRLRRREKGTLRKAVTSPATSSVAGQMHASGCWELKTAWAYYQSMTFQGVFMYDDAEVPNDM